MLLLPVRNIPAGGVACNILCARQQRWARGGECIVRVECLLPPFHRTSSSSPVDRRRFYINYCYFTHHRVCARAGAYNEYISANFHHPLLRNLDRQIDKFSWLTHPLVNKRHRRPTTEQHVVLFLLIN